MRLKPLGHPSRLHDFTIRSDGTIASDPRAASVNSRGGKELPFESRIERRDSIATGIGIIRTL